MTGSRSGGIPTGRVTVAVRLRPVNSNDEEELGTRSTSVEMDVPNSRVRVEKRSGEERFFNYDHILNPDIGQTEVYETMAAPIVLDVMQGFNGTVLAYGQTGTGKTYTLGNNLGEKSFGIIPRAFAHIFKDIEADSSHAYDVHVSYVQIYCEMIQDLLQPENNSDLRIREGPDAGVYISGVTSIRVQGPEEALQLMGTGNENRSTAFTQMNAHSSRSHACLIVNITRRTRMESDDGTAKFGKLRRGKLTLVDLAGSERVKKSGATGSVLTEAKSINLSLTCLGNVIHALTDPHHKHIPYRDSKLTRLLQDSLGGNAKTSLVATIGPSANHVSETISTLLFAQRAMKVQTYAVINEEVDYKALCSELQAALDGKDDEIHEMELRVAQAKKEAAVEAEASSNARINEEALQQLRAELEAEKATMRSMLEGDMASVRRDHEREIQQLKTTFEDALKKLKKAHQQELREQKLDHHQELTTLMEEFEHQIMFHDDEEDKWKQERNTLQKEVQAERSALALTVNESMEKDQVIHELEARLNAGDSDLGQKVEEVEKANKMLTQELQTQMKQAMLADRLKQSLESMTAECEAQHERVEELEMELHVLKSGGKAAAAAVGEGSDGEGSGDDAASDPDALLARESKQNQEKKTGESTTQHEGGEDPEVARLRSELEQLTMTLKLEIGEFDEVKSENAMLKEELDERAAEFAKLQHRLLSFSGLEKAAGRDRKTSHAGATATTSSGTQADGDTGSDNDVAVTPTRDAPVPPDSALGKTPGRRKQEFDRLLRDIDHMAVVRDENVSLRNELITMKMEAAEVSQLTTENANLLIELDRVKEQFRSDMQEKEGELRKMEAERDQAIAAGGVEEEKQRGEGTQKELEQLRETNDLLNAENEAQRAELETLREAENSDADLRSQLAEKEGVIAELQQDVLDLQQELDRVGDTDAAGSRDEGKDITDGAVGAGGEVDDLKHELAEAKARQRELEDEIVKTQKEHSAARTIQAAYRSKKDKETTLVVEKEIIVLRQEVEAKEADLKQTQAQLQERAHHMDELGARTGVTLMNQSMTHIELAFRHMRNFFLEEHSEAWKEHKRLRTEQQQATGQYPNSKMKKERKRRNTVAGPASSSRSRANSDATVASEFGGGA